MSKNIISIFFILALSCASSLSQKKEEASVVNSIDRPKLVVAIIVDQMRYDYLLKYWYNFSNNGFKRLVNKGFLLRNARYSYVPTYTAPGHACIFTGTTPSVNGIVSNSWYDREHKKEVYCVSDSSVQSVGTNAEAGKMSPRKLMTTTVCDELRLQTNFQSKTIGISLKDRGAVLPAGHSANAAYWFDPSTNNWVTSTYYMNELPAWLKNYNSKRRADEFTSKPWNTLLPLNQYTVSTGDDTRYEGLFAGETKPVFPHDLPVIKRSDVDLIRKTPFGNTITKETAIECIKGEELGKDSVTDFLSISFSSTDYVGHMYGVNAIELEDTYLRLDKDLAELIDFIELWTGNSNSLIFLTADHGAALNPIYAEDHHIPSGNISFAPIRDSLTVQLSRRFGKGNFILESNSDGIYLDRELIDQLGLDLKVVQEYCVSFLAEQEHIAAAVTSINLKKGIAPSGLNSFIQNGFYESRSPDVCMVLDPGWVELPRNTGTTHGSPYDYDTHVPLIFYGWHIKQGASSQPVDVSDIAPTISDLLHISYPSGCTGKPIKAIVE